ncbi:hypothetical protein PCASD_25750 [Puccinia coronata f. sp. avenae]|uniref:Uncharacterized protein n=1 Tax=Puccinia coronata f. sp. avenae TaxID=200324 RepID=A0A2N5RXN3_9BASI|nr:hypothetical protein PCASD_25944 [Puccinia coronata f. sp. avenae]PLW06128.1 hypothetical protein PCASD_25750 [Puccinia coronata f. sp. avenae]
MTCATVPPDPPETRNSPPPNPPLGGKQRTGRSDARAVDDLSRSNDQPTNSDTITPSNLNLRISVNNKDQISLKDRKITSLANQLFSGEVIQTEPIVIVRYDTSTVSPSTEDTDQQAV